MAPPWSLLVSIGVVVSCQATTHDSFIAELFKRVSDCQEREDQSFQPFISWEKSKGEYSNDVMLNFHGGFLQTAVRRLISIYDNNMYTTAWVTLSLLEAHVYGGAPRPSDEQLVLSINALKEYQDKNEPHNSSLMMFWKQQFNHSTNFWQCQPTNLVKFVQALSYLPMDTLAWLLDYIGLSDLADNIRHLNPNGSPVLIDFRVVPDFDDTHIYMAMGALLYQQKDQFPIAWSLWDSHNPNLTSVIDALKKYAYRPFSSDPDVNSIDPRTYFHIRGFLDQARAHGQDVALVPTWLHTMTEGRAKSQLGAFIPFYTNHIDLAGAPTVVYGLTVAVLTGLLGSHVLTDPVVERIYHNTSALIAYEIRNNLLRRLDVAFVYYTSEMQFYWFVARIVCALESYRRKGSLPAQVMETVYVMLRDLVENHVTKNILEKAERHGVDQAFFDDFLGNGDVTWNGRPLKRAEDRIFTTSMAVNALTSAWSYYDFKSRQARWKPGTPSSVLEIVKSCVNWLTENALSGNFKPWNSFYSITARETLPFWYPGNRLEYLNGTAISDWSQLPDSEFVYAVQGYIPEQQYNTMLRDTHFGFPTPMSFRGYNEDLNVFPFWSSVPYSYAATLMAVSRYNKTVS